jgi:CubicO group peptidase (beta-lactamase class C family)
MQELAKTSAAFEAGRAQGLHTGAQLYISLAGREIVNTAFGESRPGVPMSPDCIMLWFSAGKPLAAVAIAKFWESGDLDLDDRVTKFIPDFASGGKEAITIRHLLTHTGGFRSTKASENWKEMINPIAAAPLEPRWLPGRTAGYHTFTSWYILGEIIRRLDPAHSPYERFVAGEIFQPLGMSDCYLAMSLQQFRAYGARIAPITVTNNTKQNPSTLDTEAGCTICSPGSSARGPARELGRFYEMLLGRGKGVITPQSTEALTARHRSGVMDLTFKKVIDWGLGFIVNSPHYSADIPYNFGEKPSPRAFGHAGNQSSIAFADPETGLVLALIFNGMPGEPAHQNRMNQMLAAIYEDLEDSGIVRW